MKPIYFLSVESLTLTKMDRLTITQRIKIIKTNYKYGDPATGRYRALRGDYGLHNHPTMQATSKIEKKFEETMRMCRFLVVLRNKDCLTAHYGVFCIYIYTHFHIKSSSRNNWSQLTMHNVVDKWNGCLNNSQWTAIFRKKFSSALKRISHSVGMLISKIIVFGVLRIIK